MSRLRIYVAGPMTGYAGYNVGAFERAARYLRAKGHDVVTPHELNSEIWQKHHGRPFDPWTDKCDYGDPILNEMVERDLVEVCRCDAIALLPGWERSKGSHVELLTAKNLRKIVLDARTGDPMETIVIVQACVPVGKGMMDPRQIDWAGSNG